jgi:hypothetical protein
MWASREVESGSNGNMSFNNGTIYSYHWWDIAKNCETKDGKSYVIMTGYSYSSSTSKHISHVRRAIPKHIPVYYSTEKSSSYGGNYKRSPILTDDAVLNTILKEMIIRYDIFFDLKVHFKTSTEQLIATNISAYESAKEFCEFTGTKWNQDFDKYLLSESEIRIVRRMLIPYQKEMEIRRVKAEAMKEIIEAAKERVYAKFGSNEMEMAKLWIREGGEKARRSWWGEKINLPQDDPDVKASKLKFIVRSMETAMRIEGDYVVTNHSARVSVAAAKRLWGMMKNQESIIGEKVDMYTVVKNNGELVIGCHHIKREIVNYFVEYYNW